MGQNSGRGKINISQLQTFHLVARMGSFSSASRELNISYQSVANQVRKLEQVYGAKLVDTEKGSRVVRLTPQGKALHTSLGSELDTILSRISVLMHDVHSVLRVGVPQALFIHFFPNILKYFRKVSPDIELSFFERDTTLEELILQGSLDVCVTERYFGEAAISQHLLGEYHLCLIYPKAWTRRKIGSGDLHYFENRPFITYEPGQTIRSRAVDCLGHYFEHPPVMNTTASGSSSITRLVETGLGYAVVPSWCLGEDNTSVGKIILNSVEPVKVYFCNTAFLDNNEFIINLRNACEKIMSVELNP